MGARAAMIEPSFLRGRAKEQRRTSERGPRRMGNKRKVVRNILKGIKEKRSRERKARSMREREGEWGEGKKGGDADRLRGKGFCLLFTCSLLAFFFCSLFPCPSRGFRCQVSAG